MTTHYEITKAIRKIRQGRLECDVLKSCFQKDCDEVKYRGEWMTYNLSRVDKEILSSSICRAHFREWLKERNQRGKSYK